MSAARPPVIRSVESTIGDMDLLEGGVIWHTIQEGANVDFEAAQTVIRVTEELAAGCPVVVIVDLRNIGYADPEAQSVFSQSDSGGVEIGTALLVRRGISEFLASRWRTRTPPARPSQVFESEDDALSWALALASAPQ